MRGAKITVIPEDRPRLERIVRAPATPQKHVWRARWLAPTIGVLAKTDRRDARTLARFAAKLAPTAAPPALVESF